MATLSYPVEQNSGVKVENIREVEKMSDISFKLHQSSGNYVIFTNPRHGTGADLGFYSASQDLVGRVSIPQNVADKIQDDLEGWRR